MDLSTKCSKCGKAMALGEIRAMPEGKGFICRSCLEGVGASPTTHLNKPKDDKISAKTFFEKREYECTKCKYKFSRNADHFVEKCPYCGSTEIREKIDMGADEYLDDE
ncbi:MAG: hypothetical protein AB7V77_02940 [Candidatus Woesearchaeota archaeon]